LGDEVLIDHNEFVEGSIINHAKGEKIELSVKKIRDGELAGQSTFPSSISSIIQKSFVDEGENYIRSALESGKESPTRSINTQTNEMVKHLQKR